MTVAVAEADRGAIFIDHKAETRTGVAVQMWGMVAPEADTGLCYHVSAMFTNVANGENKTIPREVDRCWEMFSYKVNYPDHVFSAYGFRTPKPSLKVNSFSNATSMHFEVLILLDRCTKVYASCAPMKFPRHEGRPFSLQRLARCMRVSLPPFHTMSSKPNVVIHSTQREHYPCQYSPEPHK